MITAIFALATSVWAWVLPFAGPIIARAGISLAGARSWLPRGIGSYALAAAVGGVLLAILWHEVGRWWSPPPRTFTAAEIRASSLEAENASLKAALAARDHAIGIRDASIERLAVINDQVTTEMEQARAKIHDPGAVVVPADDSWLREYHRRGW